MIVSMLTGVQLKTKNHTAGQIGAAETALAGETMTLFCQGIVILIIPGKI